MKRIIIDIEPNRLIATLEKVSSIEALGIFEYMAKKTYENMNNTSVQTNDIKPAEITPEIKAKREFLGKPVGHLDISVRLINSLESWFRQDRNFNDNYPTIIQFRKNITALDILTSGFDYKKVRNAGEKSQKELVEFFAENGFEYGKPVPPEYL